MIPCIDMDFSK